MRTINKYFYLLAAVALAGVVSCVKEKESFQPGEPDSTTCEGVYFIKQKVIEETQIFDPTQAKKDTIKVERSDKGTLGALTVTPTVSLTAGTEEGDVTLFTVSDIVFEEGAVESYVAIAFPDVKEGVQYTLHLSIDGDEYSSKYSSALKACDYSVMCVAYQDFLNPKTKKAAKVTFTQGWWGEKHTAYIKYYEVDGLRHCSTYGEELIGVPEVDGGADGFWGKGKDYHLEFLWYQKDDEKCSDCGEKHSHTIPAGKPVPQGGELIQLDGPQFVFMNNGTTPWYLYDYYNYQLANGYKRPFLHFVDANDLYDATCYYDGNGGFYFWSLGYATAALSGQWPQDYELIGIAEGFNRADYSIKLTAGITETDADGKNVVPVEFKVGADVDKVGYTVLEGKPSAAAIANEVAAIAKDTIDFKYAKYVAAKGASFVEGVSAKSTGVFTVVAVALDTNKVVKANATVSFEYLLTGEANPVLLNVVAGSTEKYASRGYEATSSLEYTVSGVGITGAIPMIYPEAKVDAEGGIDAFVAGILEDSNDYYAMLSDSKYASYVLSATALADVNDKGYSDIAVKLSANTTYYVIVWATNGYACGVEYDVYATPGLPNEVIVDGTGYFDYKWLDETDDITFDGYNLEYNPNTKMYEIPNWGAGGSETFTFSIAADGKTLSVPVQSPGYSGYYLADYSHIDDVFGEGSAEYFTTNYGLDFTPRGYIDEDGNYVFVLFYANSAGSLWLPTEVFYPNGAPEEEPAEVASYVSVNGAKSTMNELPKLKSFIQIAGVQGLEPVASVRRIEVSDNVTMNSFKKAELGVESQLVNRF